MLAAAVCAIVRWIVVDEFNISDLPCARISAFDQIVTEQRVARKSAIEHSMEGRNLINTFPGEDSFPEEILVCVGNGARVNIEASLAREDAASREREADLNGNSHSVAAKFRIRR